jgi:transposase-like protein
VESCGINREKKGGIMSQRKKHNACIKAKVAIEAIKGDKAINELAGIYGVHPNQIGQWKKKLIAASAEIFSVKGNQQLKKMEQDQESLYKRIGELTMEAEYLKKKLGIGR